MEQEAEVHSIEVRLDYIEKMISKTEIELNRRLEGMNEFRHQIDKREETLATKEQLKPYDKFINNFWGFIFGVTVLNGVISYLLVRVFGR